jgi:hypothetical protein
MVGRRCKRWSETVRAKYYKIDSTLRNKYDGELPKTL